MCSIVKNSFHLVEIPGVGHLIFSRLQCNCFVPSTFHSLNILVLGEKFLGALQFCDVTVPTVMKGVKHETKKVTQYKI